MSFLFLNHILVLLLGISILFLGSWVYYSDKRKKQNKLFSLFSLFLFFWLASCYLGSSIINYEVSLLLGRVAYAMVALFFIVFYFFSLNFLKEEERFPFFNKLVVISNSLLFFVSLFTGFMVVAMRPTLFGNVPVLGKAKYLYLSLILFWTVFILYRFYQNYFQVSEKQKAKIQYFLIGVSIWVIFNAVFNIILPFWQDIPYYWAIGNYSAIFLVAFTAYAILKEKLFDTKIVLTAILVVLIAITLFIDIILFTDILWIQLSKILSLIIFLAFGYYLIKSIIKEIEQREKLERFAKALEEANIELRKLDASKTEFVSIASHQLRTPLTAIKGYLSMMNDGTYGRLPEKIKEKIGNVFESNERLIRLVNDLLSVSRIDTGKIVVEKEKVQVESLIENLKRELSISAKEKSIYLQFLKPSKKLPKVMADKGKLEEAILNVIDNAIKYTNKGGVTVKVEKQNKEILISVIDTGEGMNEKDLSKIFERFSRGNAGNWLHSEGAGLGLFITKKFIEMHNGKVWAESQGEGKGCQFYIKIPIK